MAFEAGKTIKELGIDTSRKFRVVDAGDNAAVSNGDILEFHRGDNFKAPLFNNLTTGSMVGCRLDRLEYADEPDESPRYIYIHKDITSDDGSHEGLGGTVKEVQEERKGEYLIEKCIWIRHNECTPLTPCTPNNTKVGDWVIGKKGNVRRVIRVGEDSMDVEDLEAHQYSYDYAFKAPSEALPDIPADDKSPTYKFKVGDRVEATHEAPKGKYGEVMYIREHLFLVKFDDWDLGHTGLGGGSPIDCGNSGYWMNERDLKLVEEEPLGLGDYPPMSQRKSFADITNYTNKSNNKTMSWTNFWEGLSTQVKKQFKPYKEQLQYGLRNSDLSLTDKAVQVLLEAYSETKEGKEALQEVIDERKAEEKKK